MNLSCGSIVLDVAQVYRTTEETDSSEQNGPHSVIKEMVV